MSDMVKMNSEMQAMRQMAEALGGSRYCNEKSAADALWIIATGKSLGLDPVTSLRGIHVIKGKPTLSADLMAAAALRHPDCVRFQVVKMDREVAIVEVLREGWEEPSRYSFSAADAKDAGLMRNPTYQKFLPDMLKARAISRAARAAFPDALLGVYVEGELDEPEPQRREPVVVEAREQRRASAEVVDAEVGPVDYSENDEWKAANRRFWGVLRDQGKARSAAYREWVKARAGVTSWKHLPASKIGQVVKYLEGLEDDERGEHVAIKAADYEQVEVA